MNIRWTISVGLRRASHALDDGFMWLDGQRQRINVELWRLSVLVDVDRQPCPECGEPGGAHLDCDLPGLGRMTATEREFAFAQDVP